MSEQADHTPFMSVPRSKSEICFKLRVSSKYLTGIIDEIKDRLTGLGYKSYDKYLSPKMLKLLNEHHGGLED